MTFPAWKSQRSEDKSHCDRLMADLETSELRPKYYRDLVGWCLEMTSRPTPIVTSTNLGVFDMQVGGGGTGSKHFRISALQRVAHNRCQVVSWVLSYGRSLSLTQFGSRVVWLGPSVKKSDQGKFKAEKKRSQHHFRERKGVIESIPHINWNQ